MTLITTYVRGLSTLCNNPVDYYLTLSNDSQIHLNSLLGKHISLTHKKDIRCCHCGRKISKTFNNGYCYPCFQRLPQNDLCYVKPSLCHYSAGTCRDACFGDSYCNQPHVVYLALSSSVKVGLTSATNPVKRWTDQGAAKGMVIALTPTRQISGQLELALATYIPDKTNWRKMLGNLPNAGDLKSTWMELRDKIPIEFQQYLVSTEPTITDIHYPVAEYPSKVISLDLVKSSPVSGVLKGIKGQYLILDTGVINIKKYSGHLVDLEFTD